LSLGAGFSSSLESKISYIVRNLVMAERCPSNLAQNPKSCPYLREIEDFLLQPKRMASYVTGFKVSTAPPTEVLKIKPNCRVYAQNEFRCRVTVKVKTPLGISERFYPLSGTLRPFKVQLQW